MVFLLEATGMMQMSESGSDSPMPKPGFLHLLGLLRSNAAGVIEQFN